MHCLPEAVLSALIIFTIFLPTSLHSVFWVSFCVGGNFMGLLRIRATMIYFLQAVGFSQTPVMLPLLRRFRNIAKSDY